MSHKAETQKTQNAVPRTPFTKPEKVQHPLEIFPFQMIILFQNLLTGLTFYFLGNPLVVNLLPVLLDEQGTVRA